MRDKERGRQEEGGRERKRGERERERESLLELHRTSLHTVSLTQALSHIP